MGALPFQKLHVLQFHCREQKKEELETRLKRQMGWILEGLDAIPRNITLTLKAMGSEGRFFFFLSNRPIWT